MHHINLLNPHREKYSCVFLQYQKKLYTYIKLNILQINLNSLKIFEDIIFDILFHQLLLVHCLSILLKNYKYLSTLNDEKRTPC